MCISNLYGQFEIAGETLDGNNTLGENIADEGGLKIALKAYENLYRQTNKGSKGPSDKDSRIFFTSFAQNWCHPHLFSS